MRSVLKSMLAAGIVWTGWLIGGQAIAKDLTIAVITHGQASDPFWSTVKEGATQAGKDAKVNVVYRSPETFDVVAMSQLIDAAVNQAPDGIVVSNPDPDALGPSIRKAVAAGIPVISINSGADAAARLGIALHVGQDELSAGRIIGARLKREGFKHALCVNPEVGNVALDQRCQGLQEGLQGGVVTVLPVSTDPAETRAKVSAALTRNPAIDVVLGLSTGFAGEPAVQAIEAAGLSGKVKVATFDLSPTFLKEVAKGKALFAIDQQPFLQGYLPVSLLAIKARYGRLPTGNVATGPSFVTQRDAERILAAEGKAAH
ncbi:sugar ABC transporter substrate-binding protein [Methylobacterium soli]|uniref:Sugar ABC transporter substrate-binding protein n=1 Tax=Methylobacterium soli TaxID=553447 RepID=A0A6L3SXP1_9HYPH|nr:sugar ABC transporter substrate-binding protein [Methylobacterium soli]KAB1077408.1 sugar ABC transporter substrate-binding protein [Methylobacterium soli]GJE44431.1 hypothetical protein AEGHOMDF_3619 [Methylobacterium soli]